MDKRSSYDIAQDIETEIYFVFVYFLIVNHLVGME